MRLIVSNKQLYESFCNRTIFFTISRLTIKFILFNPKTLQSVVFFLVLRETSTVKNNEITKFWSSGWIRWPVTMAFRPSSFVNNWTFWIFLEIYVTLIFIGVYLLLWSWWRNTRRKIPRVIEGKTISWINGQETKFKIFSLWFC